MWHFRTRSGKSKKSGLRNAPGTGRAEADDCEQNCGRFRTCSKWEKSSPICRLSGRGDSCWRRTLTGENLILNFYICSWSCAGMTNLMCRAGRCAVIRLSHLDWINDSLGVYFAQQKNDQTGERPRDPRRVTHRRSTDLLGNSISLTVQRGTKRKV